MFHFIIGVQRQKANNTKIYRVKIYPAKIFQIYNNNSTTKIRRLQCSIITRSVHPPHKVNAPASQTQLQPLMPGRELPIGIRGWSSQRPSAWPAQRPPSSRNSWGLPKARCGPCERERGRSGSLNRSGRVADNASHSGGG